MSTKADSTGITVGDTAISAVGKNATGLNYRGYDIEELAYHATFEEVAYLFLYERLPTVDELEKYRTQLKSKRYLPNTLKNVLKQIPRDAHPMDVMRTACSVLGTLEQESEDNNQIDIANRLLACLSSILMFWWHYHKSGKEIETTTDDNSIAAHFLHLLTLQQPDSDQEKLLNVALILYADHDFNTATFTARMIASAKSDFYSAVIGAIGALRGNSQSGANEVAIELIQQFNSPDEAERGILAKINAKQLIMGFGHRMYDSKDPRSDIIKKYAKKLSQKAADKKIFAISERIEEVMHREKKLFPNLDFYSASAYYFSAFQQFYLRRFSLLLVLRDGVRIFSNKEKIIKLFIQLQIMLEKQRESL